MQLYPVTAVYGATNIVASTVACKLVRVRAYLSGSTDKWLQIHDAIALPANTAVPKSSYQMLGGLDKFVDFGQIPMELVNGLVIVISDTEATLTTSATTGDFLIELEAGELYPTGLPSGVSTIGDTSTGVDSLQVWSTGTGPKKLFRVQYTNKEAVVSYLMLFGFSGPSTGMFPIMQWKVLTNVTIILYFGPDGISPIQQLSTDLLYYQGCSLFQSSTPTTLTATGDTVSFMKAWYK